MRYEQQSSGHSHDLRNQVGIENENRSWKKLEDILLSELYREFFPRWFKKEQFWGKYKASEIIAWFLPALKLGVGIGLYPLLMTFDCDSYNTVAKGLSFYLTVDGFYQMLDVRHPCAEGLRKAATVAIDLISYPVYLVLSQIHSGQQTKRYQKR